jgi:hypothetical protein
LSTNKQHSLSSLPLFTHWVHPLEIEESTCDDAAIMYLMVLPIFPFALIGITEMLLLITVTAVPITKLFAWGGEDNACQQSSRFQRGKHVLVQHRSRVQRAFQHRSLVK